MRIAYLVGQYPAINHGYILDEVRILRGNGLQIEVASVSLPDRPAALLGEIEREEFARTYYIKAVPKPAAALAVLKHGLRSPRSLFKGLRCALRMAPRTAGGVRRYLLYFVEAVLLVEWMKRSGLSHVHVTFSGSLGVIACDLAPVTMSLAVHGFGEVFDPVGSRLAARIAASSFVRSVSRHLRSLLMISCPAGEWAKLEHVPLGVDPEIFLPAPFRPAPRPFRMVCVGRLAPEKGQRLLLQAAVILRERGCAVALHLVGDGPDRPALERIVASGGLGDCVCIEGPLHGSKLLSLYREMDAFVLASLYEGIPVVLMEAMSMQIPCVAPCITGIPELIHDGLDGLLFAPADVEGLVAAIQRLVGSPELRRSLGVRARECVLREYSIAANTRRFQDVLLRHLAALSPSLQRARTV